MDELIDRVRTAVRLAPPLDDDAYRRLPECVATRLREHWPLLIKANEQDISTAVARGLPGAVIDRLRLGETQLDYLLQLTRAVAAEQETVLTAGPAREIRSWGSLQAMPKPLGVILMVYEARPTVTVEGALLCCSVGNAVILRGGQELAATNDELAGLLADAMQDAGLPRDLVQVLDDPGRQAFRALLQRPDAIDVLIPRGSPSLIDYCARHSTIPVIASGGGVNHLYIDADADLELAARIALDSKLAEPTACNTLEFVLVHQDVAAAFLASLALAVQQEGRQIAVRLEDLQEARRALGAMAGPLLQLEELTPTDLGREFQDARIGVVTVTGLDAAMSHIAQFGSGHTEGVVTSDPAVAQRFCRGVDAAALVVNGSLRLHDGPTLELGPELSISTGRLHVRGPLTLSRLVTHSWVVDARGTLRRQADAARPAHARKENARAH